MRHSGFSPLCPSQILGVVVFVGPGPVRFLLCFSAGWQKRISGGFAFRLLWFVFVLSLCFSNMQSAFNERIDMCLGWFCFWEESISMHKSSHTSDKIWAEFISQQEKKLVTSRWAGIFFNFNLFFPPVWPITLWGSVLTWEEAVWNNIYIDTRSMCAGFAAHGRRPASEDRERSICEKSSICRPAPTTNKNVPLSSKKDGGDAGRDGLFFPSNASCFRQVVQHVHA